MEIYLEQFRRYRQSKIVEWAEKFFKWIIMVLILNRIAATFRFRGNIFVCLLLIVSAVCPFRTPYYTGFQTCKDSGDCGTGGVCCMDMAGRHYCHQLSSVEWMLYDGSRKQTQHPFNNKWTIQERIHVWRKWNLFWNISSYSKRAWHSYRRKRCCCQKWNAARFPLSLD